MWSAQAKWGKRQRDINGTRSEVTTGNTGTGYRAYPPRGGAASQGDLQNGQRNQLGVTKGTCQVLGRNNPVLSSELGGRGGAATSWKAAWQDKVWERCGPLQKKTFASQPSPRGGEQPTLCEDIHGTSWMLAHTHVT